MRINNYIKSSGICSRREADRLIEAGCVYVNGVLAGTGMDIQDGDEVKVNGVIVKPQEHDIFLLLNKPIGIETTTEKKKNNIIDFVGYPERLFPIGRLDKDSCGLILLTNNGDSVNKICRQEFEHEKEYFVRVDKVLKPDFKEKMENGVEIYNPVRHCIEKTKKCKIEIVSSTEFKIILTQGLNRQIRRMSKALGYNVIYLERIRIMHITKENLKVGKYRLLTNDEIKRLKEQF